MNTNAVEACTSYIACSLVMHIQEINWATVGAVVLLVARLCKDVPDAYDAIKSRLKKKKKTQRKRKK